MNKMNFTELKNLYECVNLLLDYYGNQTIINVGDKNITDKYNRLSKIRSLIIDIMEQKIFEYEFN
jgi:hypothetical protein